MALRKKKEKKLPLASRSPRMRSFSLPPPPLDPSPHRRIVPALSLGQHGVAAGPRKRGSLRACSSFFEIVEIERSCSLSLPPAKKALSFCLHEGGESKFRRDAWESSLLATQKTGDQKKRPSRGKTNRGAQVRSGMRRRFDERKKVEESEAKKEKGFKLLLWALLKTTAKPRC